MPPSRAPIGPASRPAGRRRWLLLLPAAVLAVAGCGSASRTASAPATAAAPATTAAPDTTAGPASTTPSPSATPATGPAGVTLSTAPPPWPLPADAAPYIKAAGLQALDHETLAVHYHAHLDILAGGRPVTVPAGIGFIISNGQASALSSLHTHDTSGVIHVEAAQDRPFTLGQVFTEWGVALSPDRVGGLVSGNRQELRLYVNGARVTTPPQNLVLRPHQEIVLWYGPSDQQASVPSSYPFPAGL